MAKKVLVISASPREGGNSDTLSDQFIKGATEAGHQAEKIFIARKDIKYCTGCLVCNDTHKCVIKDDMEEVLNKMVEADVIVMATPVYFYSMDGQLKTLIDRTTPRYSEISNKDFYFIVAAVDENKKMMHRTLEGLRSFTEDCLEGAVEKGVIYGVGTRRIGEIKTMPAMQEAYEMGKGV
jgi:multimeric flavodoxin WrbA